eukprot:5610717-Pleurochrysis_carterae.AAC.2
MRQVFATSGDAASRVDSQHHRRCSAVSMAALRSSASYGLTASVLCPRVCAVAVQWPRNRFPALAPRCRRSLRLDSASSRFLAIVAEILRLCKEVRVGVLLPCLLERYSPCHTLPHSLCHNACLQALHLKQQASPAKPFKVKLKVNYTRSGKPQSLTTTIGPDCFL